MKKPIAKSGDTSNSEADGAEGGAPTETSSAAGRGGATPGRRRALTGMAGPKRRAAAASNVTPLKARMAAVEGGEAAAEAPSRGLGKAGTARAAAGKTARASASKAGGTKASPRIADEGVVVPLAGDDALARIAPVVVAVPQAPEAVAPEPVVPEPVAMAPAAMVPAAPIPAAPAQKAVADAPRRAPKPVERSLPPPPGQVLPQRPIATVPAARLQMRHFVLMALFLLMVVLPPAVSGLYLYTTAADQYESDVGFGSRTQEASNTFDILGVLGGAGGGAAAKDMDILNQFIVSQELVERVDAKLDLRKLWSRHPEDWYFSFPPDGPIEDLVEYWQSMVLVNYDTSSGLMTLRVFAFTPEDSQAIAQAIVEESGRIINELSKTAQEDTTRFSRETLADAEERFRKAQNKLADFRVAHRIVDPQLELNGASQIINGLVQQMAEAQINLDLLKGQVADNDPRIAQLTRRIEVIQNRLSQEGAKVGNLGDPADPGYAALIRDYQNLQLEMEFSQKAYLAAQGAYDQAVSDARQQTHYLSTFLKPTFPQTSTAPDRPTRMLLAALIGFLAWATMAMVYYALRDRR